MSETKFGQWTVDPNGADDGDLVVDCGMGSVILKVNEDGMSVDIYPLHIVDEPVASVWASAADLRAPNDAEFIESQKPDNRCPHGMFFSGAGACPQCGRGAEPDG